MNKSMIFCAVTALASAPLVAQAQEQGRVLSTTPIVQQVGVPQQVCGNETVYSTRPNTGAGAVMGAIAGGAVGNAIGNGSGRAAATVIGLLGGLAVGNQIEGGAQPRFENVQRCTTETYYENRTMGYDVVYEYAGRQYSVRTNQDPGAWIPLSVQPMVGQAPPQTYYETPRSYRPPPPLVSIYPAPVYVMPPVGTIEYRRDYGRHYPHPHGDPRWR